MERPGGPLNRELHSRGETQISAHAALPSRAQVKRQVDLIYVACARATQ
ncbi:hypothetical protein LEMLEM_LOCUS654 [Lemmus lemmus]